MVVKGVVTDGDGGKSVEVGERWEDGGYLVGGEKVGMLLVADEVAVGLGCEDLQA